MEPAFLENNRVIRRRHLGLGIIVATVAYVGAIKLTPSYAAEACMLLALMLTAVVLARVASAVTAMRRGGSVESETWASCRLNFKPGDMFLVAIVAVTFIGLSIWNQVRHD